MFVTVTPGPAMDIDDWLGDYAAELATLELDTWHVYTRRELPSPAWKVAFDGYLEGYHFSTLHKNTIFKDNMSNLMAVDAYGPHQRIMFAKHTLPALRDQDEAEWRPTDHIGPVHTIFPCLSLAGAWRDTALVSQLFPGPTPDRSRTAQTFITRHPVVTPEERERAEQAIDFLFTVVRDEDYATGFGITRTLMLRSEPGVRVRTQRTVLAPLPPLGGPARGYMSVTARRGEGGAGVVDCRQVGDRQLDGCRRQVLVDVCRSAAAGMGTTVGCW